MGGRAGRSRSRAVADRSGLAGARPLGCLTSICCSANGILGVRCAPHLRPAQQKCRSVRPLQPRRPCWSERYYQPWSLRRCGRARMAAQCRLRVATSSWSMARTDLQSERTGAHLLRLPMTGPAYPSSSKSTKTRTSTPRIAQSSGPWVTGVGLEAGLSQRPTASLLTSLGRWGCGDSVTRSIRRALRGSLGTGQTSSEMRLECPLVGSRLDVRLEWPN
jgi:hypothetical protein